jgi:putative ABC transport system permease protein
MKLFDWLLALYPRAFRDRFADGMRGAFGEDFACARARGRLPALRFLAVAIPHTLWFAAVERLPTPATLRAFLSTDVRDAVRSLRATPIVTAVAVLSLALGIGANTALFSILDSLVLRPLPVHDPSRLVLVGNDDWTNPIWEQIRDRQTDLFAGAGAWGANQFDLAGTGLTNPVIGAYVSGGLFHTLGVGTVRGRPIEVADDVRGGGVEGWAVVISHRLWQSRFGGQDSALGRRLSISRVPFTIVGVAPAGFDGPEVGRAMDVFVPLAAEAAIRGRQSTLENRTSWWLSVVARLRPDQTPEAAAAAFNAVRPSIRAATMPERWNGEYRASYMSDDVTMYPAATGTSPLRDRFEEPLTIIMAVVAAVLLIACANIANLMLARTSARRHELSVRLALGASRLRLGCQLLTESLVVAIAGGVAGLGLAAFGAPLLVRQLGSEASHVALNLAVDWRVLGFTAAVSLAATLLAGLAPALGLGRVDPNDAVKEQARGIAGDGRPGVRNALVVAQIALSFTLLAGAGLFVRTFSALMSTPLGFNPEHLLIVSISPAGNAAVPARLTEAARTVPGVSDASASFLTPMSGRNWTNRLEVPGGPALTRPQQTAAFNAIEPGWFHTYGMRLVAGRDVAVSDTLGSEPVAVVNEAFVRRFVGERSPIGERMRSIGLGAHPPTVIVGVVNDAVYRSIRDGVVPTVYVPLSQTRSTGSGGALTVRTAADRASVERGLSEAIRGVDPTLSFSFRDYGDQVRATTAQERLVAMLSGFFGVLAMLLAALGLYGVTAYSVSRRRPEIAVRVALGASRIGVVRLVLGQVSLLLAVGAAAGLVLSLWLSRFVGPLLFRLDPRDPWMLAATGAVLAAVGLFAGWLPARAASGVDPAAALRG